MATDIQVDVKQLFEAGAHFGHKTSRWHPKMAQYIHSKRGGIHVIDLNKTAVCLSEALDFISKQAADGKQILLVGTKRQAKDIIQNLAHETNMPCVTDRWLGGTLTNWTTIGGRVKYLKDLEGRMASGELANKYNKLEVQRFQEEIDSLNTVYSGIKELNGKPGAVFVADTIHDGIAVREANKLGIPVVAITDTNSDPTKIDFPIPANDDAIKTIELIAGYIKQAITRGKSNVKQAPKPEGQK
ncbi:MAG: 30S ribosomal protein S2 [Candidatus Saccharimonadales bacterium]